MERTELLRHAQEPKQNPTGGCRGTTAIPWLDSLHSSPHHMMNPAWPKRIDGGQPGALPENGRETGFSPANVFGQGASSEGWHVPWEDSTKTTPYRSPEGRVPCRSEGTTAVRGGTDTGCRFGGVVWAGGRQGHC
jgi:hypothetical protein